MGKTLGIVGFGQVGRRLAEVAESLGMHVLVASRDDGREALLPLLGESDVISLHVPLTEQTRGMIGRQELSVMKPQAILVNAARGAVVDQTALIEALESGKLGGAVLDVFDAEPHVPETLRSMSNVLITPHMAGGTIECRQQARLCAFENVAAVLRGTRPPNALNDLQHKNIVSRS